MRSSARRAGSPRADHAVALHARGIEHQSKGVENVLALINIALATGNIGREGCGCTMITGQGNGQGGREHGQKCDQLPGARSINDPAARAHVAKVWGIQPDELPHAGYTAQEIMNAIHEGEIKALFCHLFQSAGFAAAGGLYARSAGQVGVLRRRRFLSLRNGAACRCRSSRKSAGRGRRRHLQCGRPRDPHQKAVDPPANARPDSEIICDLARRLGKGKFFPYHSTREIFDELREASRGGIADYYGITYERIDREMGVFWPCPALDHPGTPRLFEGGVSLHPDGKCRFLVTEWRESGDPVGDDCPIYLTTGRVVSQYLSGTQTRRIGGLVDMYPEPRVEIHPRLAAQHGIEDKDWVTVTTRRAAITLRALVVKTIRPDTVFIPYHWANQQSANKLTHRTLDPRSKIPEFKVSACRISKAEQQPRSRGRREL